MVSFEIDGKKVEAEEGSMVIHAADAAGIYIPRFCYHKKLSIAANCRMCLVEVEKAPKPLPACATPVVEGMKVFTQSAQAIDAQKGTMEFLLINHPLDCPICDQGGECELQDLAVGYGGDVSRFQENKRVVLNKDLGTLISTDMTRCIHCTRCVRFGQEIAGIMELGATGRGEHMEIGTYIEHSIDSELSGNVIDLCPVGALTSKPFRYSARTWELNDVAAVSPHDAVGSNLYLQVRRDRVMRALPRDNAAVNECWLSDRDRFSYEALNSEQRLVLPMIRVNGELQATDWKTALDFTVKGLSKVIDLCGSDSIGALAASNATLEEYYLLQKLVRGLGSSNIDHRLRQSDFSHDAVAPLFPSIGLPIADIEQQQGVLIIGSNVRKEQPIIGLRLRKAFLGAARIMAINAVDYEFSFDLAHKVITPPKQFVASLSRIAKKLANETGTTIPAAVGDWAGDVAVSDSEQDIAKVLAQTGNQTALLMGQLAVSHEYYDSIYQISQVIADMIGATVGTMLSANSAGAWLAGCVPHRGVLGSTENNPGLNAGQMQKQSLKAYILFGVEPELDCVDGANASNAIGSADFVVNLSSFMSSASDYADVQLPLAAFSETSGTYINGEGRVQSFGGAVSPKGEARPGWKILRVLGNMFELDGFDYTSSPEVFAELDLSNLEPSAKLREVAIMAPPKTETTSEIDLERICEVPLYASDPLVRRAHALQACADNPPPAARVNAAQAKELNFSSGTKINAHMGAAIVALELIIDDRIPNGCILIPSGYPETAALGGPGMTRVVRA
ncbi:MAG TPA: NADH-quinone oxidoreductase subunit G [Acidiferrobacteraceae bacterium]|nr:NADH-quinone oxidoreductase subunit G [Acidiferrobacteraceae bacterium]